MDMKLPSIFFFRRKLPLQDLEVTSNVFIADFSQPHALLLDSGKYVGSIHPVAHFVATLQCFSSVPNVLLLN